MHLHSRFGGFRELVGLLAHLYVGWSFGRQRAESGRSAGKLGNSQSLRDKLGHENDAKLQHRVPRSPLLLPAAGALGDDGGGQLRSEVGPLARSRHDATAADAGKKGWGLLRHLRRWPEIIHVNRETRLVSSLIESPVGDDEGREAD